jgi:hypothetical protein
MLGIQLSVCADFSPIMMFFTGWWILDYISVTSTVPSSLSSSIVSDSRSALMTVLLE